MPRNQPGPSNSEEEEGLHVLNFVNKIYNLPENLLDFNLEILLFQGFDPKEFLKHLHILAKNSNIDMVTHKKNLIFLGSVCAVRDSKENKIINSVGSHPDLKTRLGELRAAYNIVEGRPTNKMAVTLPRLLAVTALPISKLLCSPRGQMLTLSILPSEVCANYPRAFCMCQAGALIPLGNKYDDLIDAVAFGQYAITKKFNGKSSETQIRQFVITAAQSTLWTIDQKMANLRALNIVDNAGGLYPLVYEAITLASEMFKALPKNPL